MAPWMLCLIPLPGLCFPMGWHFATHTPSRTLNRDSHLPFIVQITVTLMAVQFPVINPIFMVKVHVVLSQASWLVKLPRGEKDNRDGIC